MTFTLDYDEFDGLMADTESETSAAEAHGLLMGMIAAGLPQDNKSWKVPLMQHLNNGKVLPQPVMQQIEKLIDESFEGLDEQILAIDLLLPGDDYPLVDRLESVSQWCQGFLAGFGSQVGEQDISDHDLDEALKDLTEIAQVDLEVDESEAMQSAFEIVLEHVRVASQVIYNTIRQLRLKQKTTIKPPTSSGSQSIH